jgi:cytochrome c551/c552
VGFLEELTILPPPDHLSILGYVIVGTLFIHVPYMALVLGCSLTSLLFNVAGRWKRNPTYRRFARDVVGAVAGRAGLMAILGVVPQIVLTLALAQEFFGRGIFRSDMQAPVPVLVLVGLALIYSYGRTLERGEGGALVDVNVLLGFGGAASIMLAFLIFYGVMGMLVSPDSWSFPSAPIEFVMASSVTPAYMSFLTLSLGLAGAWILFLYFGWPETERPGEPGYLSFLKTAGLVMTGGFVLVQPLFVLWSGLATPPAAVTPRSLELTALAMVLIVSIALVLVSSRARDGGRLGLYVLPLVLLTYMTGAVDGQVLRQRATAEPRSLVADEAESARDEIMARLENLGDATSPERGRQIFEGRCMACHRFDSRLVGPPLATVLSKYAGNPENLRAFVTNPVKVNPDYPSMPRLGLRSTDIEAVTNYVLQKFKEDYGGE